MLAYRGISRRAVRGHRIDSRKPHLIRNNTVEWLKPPILGPSSAARCGRSVSWPSRAWLYGVSELRGKIVAPAESALIGDGTVVVLGWRALIIMTWTDVFTAGANQDLEAPVGATLWG